MKIGFDAKRLFNNFTGLGNYSRTLVRNLLRYYPDSEIHLFSPNIKANEETLEFLKPPYHVHTNNSFWPDALWRSYFVSKSINELKLDIFHGLSHEIPFGIGPETKTVVSIHDLIYLKLPNTFSWVDRQSFDLKYRSSARRANHIIAISQKTKNDIVHEYNIPTEKISVVYQSCHDSFFGSTYGSLRKGPIPYFLYVGSITERKSLGLVVEAYRYWSEKDRIPCYVIGTGRGYERQVKDTIRKYGLDDCFQFLGNIANGQLIGYYRNAKTTILPSLYEGFGIPVIESILCGTPVICTNNSSLPEAAGPGALLIEPGDHIGLLNAMSRMLDSSQQKHLAEEGREYVLQHFSPEVTAKNLMEVYELILD